MVQKVKLHRLYKSAVSCQPLLWHSAVIAKYKELPFCRGLLKQPYVLRNDRELRRWRAFTLNEREILCVTYNPIIRRDKIKDLRTAGDTLRLKLRMVVLAQHLSRYRLELIRRHHMSVQSR